VIDISLLPASFCGYAAFFNIIFVIITALVSATALTIYKLTKQQAAKLLSIAFGLIAVSYVALLLLNLSVFTELNNAICTIIGIPESNTLFGLEMYAHAILYLLGIGTLVYMTLHIKKMPVFLLLIITVIFGIMGAENPLFMFHLLAALLLIYVVIFYGIRYSKKPNLSSLILIITFTLLCLSNILFLFPMSYENFYIYSHVLALAAYIIILIDLLIMHRK
jgi:hypothetical protein